MSDPEARAIHAQQLLDDELLTQALDSIELDALNTARAAKLRGEDCIAVISRLQAAYLVRDELKSVLTTGKAEKQKRTAVA